MSFWGEGAAGLIGLPKVRVHVVLNVAHGGTNPIELKRLITALPGRVRVHEHLHAKIYASQTRAMIGCSATTILAGADNHLGRWG